MTQSKRTFFLKSAVAAGIALVATAAAAPVSANDQYGSQYDSRNDYQYGQPYSYYQDGWLDVNAYLGGSSPYWIPTEYRHHLRHNHYGHTPRGYVRIAPGIVVHMGAWEKIRHYNNHNRRHYSGHDNRHTYKVHYRGRDYSYDRHSRNNHRTDRHQKRDRYDRHDRQHYEQQKHHDRDRNRDHDRNRDRHDKGGTHGHRN